MDWTEPKLTPKQQKAYEFRQLLGVIEGVFRLPVPEKQLVKALMITGATQQQAKLYIRQMLREAAIYECKKEHYNLV
jgi:hypothetical protein